MGYVSKFTRENKGEFAHFAPTDMAPYNIDNVSLNGKGVYMEAFKKLSIEQSNGLNVCRHCNKVIPVGHVAFRISSWWLLCRSCFNGHHQVKVIKVQDEILIQDHI